MTVQLTHPFKDTVFDVMDLLDGCEEAQIKISQFCAKLAYQADQFADASYPELAKIRLQELPKDEDNPQDEGEMTNKERLMKPWWEACNDYKGDGLECLVEFLIKRGGTKDLLLPVKEDTYKVVDRNSDTGVDGYGTHLDGRPLTVQAKFKSRSDVILGANKDRLTNFTSTSYEKFGVKQQQERDHEHMFIITTGGGIYPHSLHQQLHGRVTVIHRFGRTTVLGEDQAGLHQMTDNADFWSEFRASLLTSKDQTPTSLRKEPRLKQVEAINKVMVALSSDDGNGNTLIASPTGTGKTLIMAEVASEFFKKRQAQNLFHYKEVVQKLGLPLDLTDDQFRRLAIAIENAPNQNQTMSIDVGLLLQLLKGGK